MIKSTARKGGTEGLKERDVLKKQIRPGRCGRGTASWVHSRKILSIINTDAAPLEILKTEDNTAKLRKTLEKLERVRAEWWKIVHNNFHRFPQIPIILTGLDYNLSAGFENDLHPKT